MSISIGTRIPPKLGREGLQAVAQFAQSIGLQALDLPELTTEAMQICNDYGLRIGSVDAGGAGQLLSRDAARRKESLARTLAHIDQMGELGGQVMFMCLVPEDHAQPIAESLGYFEEVFPSVVSACEVAGIRIALEGWPGPGPYYGTLGYTPEVWRAMFRAVSSPSLGLCFDPSHLVRLGIDYLRVFTEFQDRIYHCHGKDTELLGESQYLYGHLGVKLDRAPDFSEGAWRYCIPGDGEVDWKRIVYQLTVSGYTGCISIELEDARYWGTLELEKQGIIRAYKHLVAQF